MENKDLAYAARVALKGKWGLAISTCIIYIVITGILGVIRVAGPVISLLVSGPFALGLALFSLSLSRNENAQMEQIFYGFRFFEKSMTTYLLMLFEIIWRLLLLIIPGIIAAFSYALTFYLLADDMSLKPREALKKSKEWMDGYKAKLFYLCLRFLLLSILCILTLGIGFFWLFPFVEVTMAKFYDDVKTARLASTA